MRPMAMFRGVLGCVVCVVLGSAACSSSDDPPPSNAAGGSSGKSSGGSSSKGGSGGSHAGGKGGASASGAAGAADTDPGLSGAAGEPDRGEGGAAGGDDSAPEGGAADAGTTAGNGGSSGATTINGTGGGTASGCSDDASCASGVCGENHDCQSCISDRECGDQRVCGAQQCAVACTAQAEGTSNGCGANLTCCSLHCVDTVSDSKHCGACGTACSAAQFCGSSGCVSSALASVCDVPKVVVVLDGQTGDDPVGRSVGHLLVAHCPTPPSVREISQTVADALNPSTGQPVTGGDELIVLAGGDAVQSVAHYLTSGQVAPLLNGFNNGNYQIIDRRTNAVIASEASADANASHDIFAVQFVHDATSDSIVLNTYGFSPEGTAAAAVYLEQVLLPNLASSKASFYVGEWHDLNGDTLADSSELVLLGSGS